MSLYKIKVVAEGYIYASSPSSYEANEHADEFIANLTPEQLGEILMDHVEVAEVELEEYSGADTSDER